MTYRGGGRALCPGTKGALKAPQPLAQADRCVCWVWMSLAIIVSSVRFKHPSSHPRSLSQPQKDEFSPWVAATQNPVDLAYCPPFSILSRAARGQTNRMTLRHLPALRECCNFFSIDVMLVSALEVRIVGGRSLVAPQRAFRYSIYRTVGREA